MQLLLQRIVVARQDEQALALASGHMKIERRPERLLLLNTTLNGKTVLHRGLFVFESAFARGGAVVAVAVDGVDGACGVWTKVTSHRRFSVSAKDSRPIDGRSIDARYLASYNGNTGCNSISVRIQHKEEMVQRRVSLYRLKSHLTLAA